MLFSIIVPVYNRPDEIADLMSSLAAQTDKGFEIVIVEDGSTVTCREEALAHAGDCSLQYFYKENEGRSIARNYGMDRAKGDFFIFVDSDCILPPFYIERLRKEIAAGNIAFFGGPDAAHESFSPTQKAINFAMTSFLTTGGIRGGKIRMEKFVPRTFNMGYTKEVYQKAGGFREMFSEDIDMSTRVKKAGYNPVLLRDCFVYHKRRGNLRKFWNQVHIFGMSRITLQLLYPGSMKLVHWAPAIFVIGASALIIASFFNPWFIAPLVAYILLLWLSALCTLKNFKESFIAVAADLVQLTGYGTGFIKAYFKKILMRRGRDEQEEIRLRKGK